MQFELRIYRFNVIWHTAIYIQYSAGEFATGFSVITVIRLIQKNTDKFTI